LADIGHPSVPNQLALREIPNQVALREIPNQVALREIPNQLALREIPNQLALRERYWPPLSTQPVSLERDIGHPLPLPTSNSC
jgi:hypothetical protein